MKFETYPQLIEWFDARKRRAEMGAVKSYLTGCVEQEASCLLELLRREGVRRTKSVKEQAQSDAQEQYLVQINAALGLDDGPLVFNTYWEIIGSHDRCEIPARAIAEAILDRLNYE